MCKGKGGCTVYWITKILVIIGGINWGLVGLGMLLGSMSDWNVVSIILGSMPALEGIVYVLVGVSAVMMIFGCECNKCKDGVCVTCAPEESKTEGNT